MVTENQQHGFMKKKSRLTTLTAFHADMTVSMDERRAIVVVCLHFSKAFNPVSHNVLTDKLIKYMLDKWPVR